MRLGLPVEVDRPVSGDVRGRAAGGPALVVDRDGVEGHVRVRVLDVAVEDGHVAAEPHRADAGLVQQAHQLVLELRDNRVAVARADRPGDRLLGEIHRVVGRAADADADDPGRARLAAGADDRLEYELLDPLHAVGGDAHLQEAHVLGARALRHALDVEPVPVVDELPVHDREPVAGVRTGVLAGERVDGVRAQRVLQRRALRTGLQRFVDARRVEREVLADTAGVDSDARVLADEVVLVVGDLDVLDDRVEHALARDRGLPLLCVDERIPQVLRDVLQRPDVEVRRCVLDRLLEIRCDDAHARTNPSISFQCSAMPSGSTGSRPKSTPSLEAQRATSNTPPAASTTLPEKLQWSDARKTTPGTTCSGSSSPGATWRTSTRVAAAGEIAFERMPCSSPSAAVTIISPNCAILAAA